MISNRVSLGSPRSYSLERRNAQAFLIDLGGIGGVRPGDASANVGVVADGRGEGQALAVEVDRLEDEDVGQVHAAGEWIVEGIDVARRDSDRRSAS